MNLAAATESCARVEDDARFSELMANGMRCNVEFLDADVEKGGRRFVIAVVDWGNVVVSGLHESHIDNVSTVPRSPMCRRRSVLVVQLDAQACSRATRSRTTNGKHTREKNARFSAGGRRAQKMREKFVNVGRP